MKTTTRTYLVTVELAGDDPARFDREITNYLASGDGPFAEDFGPDAWGGYDGPRAMSVSVSVSVSVQPEPLPDEPLLDCVWQDGAWVEVKL
ncbi:MAG: hypothetical protein RL134_2513 [Actinomycetota bacterium]|jgi:hypothetical protein